MAARQRRREARALKFGSGANNGQPVTAQAPADTQFYPSEHSDSHHEEQLHSNLSNQDNGLSRNSEGAAPQEKRERDVTLGKQGQSQFPDDETECYNSEFDTTSIPQDLARPLSKSLVQDLRKPFTFEEFNRKMAPATPLTPREPNGRAATSDPPGPHPSFIEVAKPFIFEKKIRECLKIIGMNEAKEDAVRLQGVAWIDQVRKALQLPMRTFNTAVVYYHKFRLVHADSEYGYKVS